MLAYLVRRLLWAIAVLVATALLSYGMIRVLRPESFGGEPVVGGVIGDLDAVFLHFDLGEACGFRGCPEIRELWRDGYAADLSLLACSLAVGVGFGIAGGVWCATRPRTFGARAVESAAALMYCAPVYVVGLGALLLFSGGFGIVPLPFFFDVHVYESPFESPWDWLRSLVVPALIVGAPVGAACLRLTIALSRDAMGEHYVRTAFAKGLPHARVVRRHAAPAAYPTLASYVGAVVPLVVTNVVLVESVFSVPGFFRHTRRALGQVPGADLDIPTLQALALWAAVLIVIGSLACDLVLTWLDPRLRASGRPPG